MSHDEWTHRNKQTMLAEKQTMFRELLAHVEQYVSYTEDAAHVIQNVDKTVILKKAKQLRALLNRAWKTL